MVASVGPVDHQVVVDDADGHARDHNLSIRHAGEDIGIDRAHHRHQLAPIETLQAEHPAVLGWSSPRLARFLFGSEQVLQETQHGGSSQPLLTGLRHGKSKRGGVMLA